VRPIPIGRIVDEPTVRYLDERGREVAVPRGFEHFSRPAATGSIGA